MYAKYNNAVKTAFVTGANRGLGKGFASYLLDNGYTVFAGVLDPQAVTYTHPNLVVVPLDISDDAAIHNAFEMVSAKSDSLDLLINNAGLNKDTATNGNKNLVCVLEELDRDYLLRLFNVNAVGALMVTKAFLPLFKNDPSFVMNISSCRASYHDEYENMTGNYGYRASKAALNMLTYCSTWDLPKHIKTFAVHPGGVKTDMNPTGEHDPYQQAERMIAIIKNWDDAWHGRFLRFDGTLYPL